MYGNKKVVINGVHFYSSIKIMTKLANKLKTPLLLQPEFVNETVALSHDPTATVTGDKQPPPPDFMLGTVQSDKHCSPDNCQTQTRPLDCPTEKHPMICIALGDVRLTKTVSRTQSRSYR